MIVKMKGKGKGVPLH